ncbi:C-type lectin domain family 12 member B [Bombina bombina]|uniref:C-type lectin domain family 12 member B n=1 Tax=Bombina bombina TaxID=8345 RepID=UPI00235A6DDE|nr:C-type lectin domain family 12 member B [Bombina bombina]
MADPITYAELNFLKKKQESSVRTDGSQNLHSEEDKHVTSGDKVLRSSKGSSSKHQKCIYSALTLCCLVLLITTVTLAVKYVEVSREMKCNTNASIALNSSLSMNIGDKEFELKHIEELQDKCNQTEERLKAEVTATKEKLIKGYCQDDWMRVKHKCLYFSETRKSWYQSRDDCLRKNATLLIIKQEDTHLQMLLEMIQEQFYIGLKIHTDGQWHWLDGYLASANYENGYCGVLFRNTPYSTPCKTEYRWICERKPALI